MEGAAGGVFTLAVAVNNETLAVGTTKKKRRSDQRRTQEGTRRVSATKKGHSDMNSISANNKR